MNTNTLNTAITFWEGANESARLAWTGNGSRRDFNSLTLAEQVSLFKALGLPLSSLWLN